MSRQWLGALIYGVLVGIVFFLFYGMLTNLTGFTPWRHPNDYTIILGALAGIAAYRPGWAVLLALGWTLFIFWLGQDMLNVLPHAVRVFAFAALTAVPILLPHWLPARFMAGRPR